LFFSLKIILIQTMQSGRRSSGAAAAAAPVGSQARIPRPAMRGGRGIDPAHRVRDDEPSPAGNQGIAIPRAAVPPPAPGTQGDAPLAGGRPQHVVSPRDAPVAGGQFEANLVDSLDDANPGDVLDENGSIVISRRRASRQRLSAQTFDVDPSAVSCSTCNSWPLS
jgi:hypothetical protein